MKKSAVVRYVIVLLLAGAIIYLGVGWTNTMIELKKQSQLAKIQETNIKVTEFLKLFIANVLKNRKEVTFEERLQLENAVLDLKDQKILDQWRKFTASKTESEAQETTVQLLELLVNNIK